MSAMLWPVPLSTILLTKFRIDMSVISSCAQLPLFYFRPYNILIPIRKMNRNFKHCLLFIMPSTYQTCEALQIPVNLTFIICTSKTYRKIYGFKTKYHLWYKKSSCTARTMHILTWTYCQKIALKTPMKYKRGLVTIWVKSYCLTFIG